MKKMYKYPENPSNRVEFWGYKIVVPDEETRQEMMAAFKHLHDSVDIDTDFILVNQLVHEYEDGRNIVVKGGSG